MRGVCDGLVLRECEYGENDKLIIVLTAEQGKISFIAKGARSMKSKTMPLCHRFTYANLEYYEKYDRRWLSGGSVETNFFGISQDLEGFALASYIAQLAEEISGEGVPAPDVLRMTLNSLYAIQKRLKPLSLIKSAYEIFAADVSGFAPDLNACCDCGAENTEGAWWLDVMNGRTVCGACFSKRGQGEIVAPTDALMTANVFLPMTAHGLAAWRYVSRAEIKRAFAFDTGDGESTDMLSRATESYILNHLERGFDTLDFYHTVKD